MVEACCQPYDEWHFGYRQPLEARMDIAAQHFVPRQNDGKAGRIQFRSIQEPQPTTFPPGRVAAIFPLGLKGGLALSHYQNRGDAIYGEFAQTLIEYVQDCFARMHKHVHEKYWNNSVWSYIKRVYYVCKHDLGLAEYYVPTCLNQDGIMQFHRIVISALPELDQDIFDVEVSLMLKPFTKPMGIIDSNTVFVVAPRTTASHKMKVKKLGRSAMIKIRRIFKGLAIPIITDVPEIAIKKVLTHLTHFWNVRVQRLLEKINVHPWEYNYNLTNLLNGSITVIEKVHAVIKQNVKSMTSTLLWLTDKLKLALKRIGNMNILKNKVFAGLSEVEASTIPDRFIRELKTAIEAIVRKAQLASHWHPTKS